MRYEISEQEFFPIPDIALIKDYKAYPEVREETENDVLASLVIELEYYNQEYIEATTILRMPFELNLIDKKLDEITLSEINFETVDNQGINVLFTLFIEATELFTKEAIKESYDELLEASLKRDDSDVAFSDFQNVFADDFKECISNADIEGIPGSTDLESKQEDVIEPIIIIEDPGIPVAASYTDLQCPFSNLHEGYSGVRIIYVSDEAELNKISTKYQIPLDRLYRSWDKDLKRVVVKDES